MENPTLQVSWSVGSVAPSVQSAYCTLISPGQRRHQHDPAAVGCAACVCAAAGAARARGFDMSDQRCVFDGSAREMRTR